MQIDLEYINSHIRVGYKLNPNEKVVNGILNGLNRNNGECPCANTSIDKCCPCSNYRELGKCCCKLYVPV